MRCSLRNNKLDEEFERYGYWKTDGPYASSRVKLNYRKRYEEGWWSLALLDSALFAMVPINARDGDELVVLHGSRLPLVLRPMEGSGGDTMKVSGLVPGGAFVYGFMDGEAQEGVEKGELKEEIFVLG
jgi:hypothetical protein